MKTYSVTMLTRRYGAIGAFHPRSYTVSAESPTLAIVRAINAAHDSVPAHEVDHVTAVLEQTAPVLSCGTDNV